MSHKPPPLESIHHVHLTAVCGVGMAALAGLFKSMGIRVTGSDEQFYPPMGPVLQRLGIEVYTGYRPENVASRPDLVVIGNKVSRNNAEVQGILAADLPFISMPEALSRFFLASRESLVVAGTHGKTTSTAMLAWVLECSGFDPSFMVGGETRNFGGNFKLGSGRHFVVEGDEYDSAFFDKRPKFIHYQPHAVLLTAVEFDHADIYSDLEAVKAAFGQLLELLPPQGLFVACSDFPHAIDVSAARTAPPTTFGLGAGAEWRVVNLRDDGGRTAFDVVRGDSVEDHLNLVQPGPINARNALGVYVLARLLGAPAEALREGLASFQGVARRQEVVGEFGGVVVIDDFAHHPTAVAGVLDAIRVRYPRQRLWALFEPRSNTSRRRVFQKEYVGAFSVADRVVVAGVFLKESDRLQAAELFSPDELVSDIQKTGVDAVSLASTDAIVDHLVARVETGDVVVMMSNGDFGWLRGKLSAALVHRDRSPVSS